MQNGSPEPDQARLPQPDRFDLPATDVPPGRSQPKRVPPPRRQGDSRALQRAALGVATFVVSLILISLFYGVVVSPAFRDVAFENGTTAAVALLIGCFTLSADQRRALPAKCNLLICLTVLAVTPWTYQTGNRLEDAGMDLATGVNFLFEIVLAVVLYRFAARYHSRYCGSRQP